VYCNECVSSIRHLLHSHLSLFPSLLPPSFPINFPFPYKVFLQSIHWVQSPHQLVFRFLASVPIFFSCSAVCETRPCVYLSLLPRLFPFPSSLKCSQHFFPFSCGLHFSFLPSLSSFVFLSSSFPFCRAHNCITERLFSQLTLSPLPVPILIHSWYFHTCTCRSRTELYCLFVSTAERDEENNAEISRPGYKASSNRRIS